MGPLMSKNLIVQLLFITAFIGTHIQAKLDPMLRRVSQTIVTVHNQTNKAIFVKNPASNPFYISSIENYGIIAAQNSDSYNIDYSIGNSANPKYALNLRIFNATSNSGPYLYVTIINELKDNVRIEVSEYDSLGITIKNSYTLDVPRTSKGPTTLDIAVKPASNDFGIKIEAYKK